MTINVTNLPSSPQYFAHFLGNGNNRGRLFILTNGAAPGAFRLGIASASATASITNLTDLSTNTDHRVVIRYVLNPASTTLWLNPSAETDSSVSATDSATAIAMTAFAFRQTTGEGNLFVDDLVVGSTFSDLIAAVPPTITAHPQSQTVNEGSTVNFSASADGGSLSFQWRFNGADIPGATSPTLSLTNVSISQAGSYVMAVTNVAGATNSNPATLTIIPRTAGALSIMDYNTHGNFATNWSTNAAQIQAIARQVQYLNPDIITFQEIPLNRTYEMTNFLNAFLPGYYMATNSGSDGFIRSVILSRFPITRSQKWLDGADLAPFGYTNANFTRDLFEAQIAVPNFPQPVHVFTAHLKSGTSSADDAARRAAEASAISNFFVTAFLTTNSSHPYLLTGDMNEDVSRPATGSQQPIQRLANTATGLHLTTPLNPISNSELTYSIQNTNTGPTRRYDYVFPSSILFSNINSAQVFRTDLLSPTPTNLFWDDNITSSDHLPVFMVFNNPYVVPFRISSFGVTNQTVTLKWETDAGHDYRVESSVNLTNWIPAVTITATTNTATFSTNSVGDAMYFRIYRAP